MSLDDQTGSLTISNRFQRIETTLSRIEDKLDQKANTNEMDRLEARIMSLEIKINTIEAVNQAVASSRQNASKLTLTLIGMVVSMLIAAAGIVLQIVR